MTDDTDTFAILRKHDDEQTFEFDNPLSTTPRVAEPSGGRLRTILKEHDALSENPLAITQGDLVEMGIVSPRSKLQALRLLKESAFSKSRDAKNLRLAWSRDVAWEGFRSKTPTWWGFPCCCLIFLFRLIAENNETYELSNHALSLTIKSPLCYTRKLVIYLRSITSVVLMESDPVTGLQSCLGLKLMKNETYLRIRTECGTFAALRLKREQAHETVDLLLARVRSARAISSAVEIAANRLRSRRLAGRRRRFTAAGGGASKPRGCCGVVWEAFSNRRSTAFWAKQLLLEGVETAVIAVTLYSAEIGDGGSERRINYFATAERCFITAVVVNLVSIAPLWALVELFRLERALLAGR